MAAEEVFKSYAEMQAISVTIDCWTSIKSESYCSLTAHFIDDLWNLRSCNLECSPFSGHHTAADIARKLNELTEKKGIKDLICIVTDNEPTNNLAANSHFNHPWIGCMDHLIQIIIRKAFSVPEIKSITTKCSQLATNIFNSNLIFEELKTLQFNDAAELSPHQHVCTRWWSSYELFRRTLALQFQLRCMMHQGLLEKLMNEEWELIDAVFEMLTPFHKIQQLTQAKKHSTISLYGFIVELLRDEINFLKNYNKKSIATNEIIRKAAADMDQKMIERFGNGIEGTKLREHETLGPRRIRKGIPREAFLAMSLDLRFKDLEILTNTEREVLIDWLIKQAVEESRKVRQPTESTQNTQNTENTQQSSIPSMDQISQSISPQQNLSLRNKSRRILHSSDPVVRELSIEDKVKLEIARFRALPSEELFDEYDKLNFDVISWWKCHHYEFPLLAPVARRLLAIPISAAESERVFSVSENILGKKRTSVKGERLSNLVFLRDVWDLMEEIEQQYE